MDPSLSVSGDPHGPSQYPPFAQFPTSFVSGHVSAQNQPLFGGQTFNQNPFNSHGFQPQTQTPPSQAAPPPPTPSLNNPSYPELICRAIAALNEADGSSKMAISRYIERSCPAVPTSGHASLLTNNLKSLKNSGVLTMVKKSYKFATSSPPQSVGVAAAAAGLVAPRSEIPPSNTGPLDPVAVSASGSASQSQKRGRGRPPKPKPETPQQQQQPINVQPIAVQSNGLSSWGQPELPVTNPTQEVTVSASASEKRRPGRPRKYGSAPIVPAAGMAVIMKRRGRPPGRRAAGRQRKPISVSATASVFPYVANGARRRGRPRRIVSSGVTTVAPTGGETVAVAPGVKRGRGRPPKIGGVMNRLITKPKRGRGRPVGRPRKNTTWPVTGATGALESAYRDLKGKLDLFNEKAKEILNVMNAGITSGDNQAVAQAAQELEGLLPMLTVEPLAKEEVQPEEAAPHTEAETRGEHEQGGEQALTQSQTQIEIQTQTEAEAME